MSSAPARAAGSQRKPFTDSPLLRLNVPMPRGGGIAATKVPKSVADSRVDETQLVSGAVYSLRTSGSVSAPWVMARVGWPPSFRIAQTAWARTRAD